MRSSESLFFDIRGLRYHVRHWRGDPARRMVLLHGWMDVSASFQFMVDALRGDWDVYAPDWRGYGLTAWAKTDSYWFPDYLADLDQLIVGVEEDRQHDEGRHAHVESAEMRVAHVQERQRHEQRRDDRDRVVEDAPADRKHPPDGQCAHDGREATA